MDLEQPVSRLRVRGHDTLVRSRVGLGVLSTTSGSTNALALANLSAGPGWILRRGVAAGWSALRRVLGRRGSRIGGRLLGAGGGEHDGRDGRREWTQFESHRGSRF